MIRKSKGIKKYFFVQRQPFCRLKKNPHSSIITLQKMPSLLLVFSCKVKVKAIETRHIFLEENMENTP